MTVIVVEGGSAKFPLGSVVATTNFIHKAKKLGEDPDALIKTALSKHVLGDWGECCATDSRENDRALKSGEEMTGEPTSRRLHSVYRTKSGQKFWVITEWDRSVTTILLPEDY